MGNPRTFVRFGTQRRDAWWLEILPVIVVMGGFSVYATVRAFEGNYYEWGPYLSPFYSPLIDPEHKWWPLSPALLILAFPLGFRATCYYYRKALYRAFLLDPAACAVDEIARRPGYKGEAGFPFILMNVHRYFFYMAVVFIVVLWYDALKAFWWDGRLGIGVGTLVMLTNVVLLSLYTFSCHSWRHFAGGRLDCFSCAKFGGAQHAAWKRTSWLNERHMLWAWMSLFSVGLTDFYIRLVSCGAIPDLRLL